MLEIGLTGGIGSGKTRVADMFAARGAAIIDTDLLAHQITAPGGRAIPALVEAFGTECLRPDGAMDRDAMRALVFADPAAKARLEGITHPLIRALTNEHAGSDGDIFSHCFKLMQIGKLVGTRTWGGVIGINPRHKLVDGSETTQPEFSFWFTDVGFAVENYGTDPEIEVDNAPQDAVAGRDRQLETALATAMELARTASSSKPEFGERPVLRRAALPPRKAVK